MIDSEETKILGGGNRNGQQSQTAPMDHERTEVVSSQSTKKDSGMSKAAFAAGAFMAGAASTGAVHAMAGQKSSDGIDQVPVTAEEEPMPVAEQQTQTEAEKEAMIVNPSDSPSEMDAIIATDEGIRVAQVDDGKSFAEAFADARAQVGSGGVFEWHGKVYGTYYKNEWDQMSTEERAEWQAKVDYDDVRDPNEAQLYAQHTENEHPSSAAVHTVSQEEQGEALDQDPVMQSGQQMVDDTPADGEIRVLAVEHVTDDYGDEMNIALLEHSSGDQALLVDIDDNGQFDVLLHDDNGDSQISEDEVYDASEMNMSVDELQQLASEQNGMDYYANNDDMLDYSNNADPSSFI